MPWPTSQPPSRCAPTAGTRRSQPKRSAPASMQANRFREENGMSFSGSRAGSLTRRSSTGSIPNSTANSSIADSSANIPGA